MQTWRKNDTSRGVLQSFVEEKATFTHHTRTVYAHLCRILCHTTWCMFLPFALARVLFLCGSFDHHLGLPVRPCWSEWATARSFKTNARREQRWESRLVPRHFLHPWRHYFNKFIQWHVRIHGQHSHYQQKLVIICHHSSWWCFFVSFRFCWKHQQHHCVFCCFHGIVVLPFWRFVQVTTPCRMQKIESHIFRI